MPFSRNQNKTCCALYAPTPKCRTYFFASSFYSLTHINAPVMQLTETPWDLSFLFNLQQPLNSSLYFDTYYNDYGKLVITFLMAALLCFLLFILSYFFSFANQKEYEKTSEYECGFEPFDSATRQPYDVHFFMVGILFLVFDVEIALLFPWAANLSMVASTGFWSTVLFLVILTIGFVYEWQRGALSWPHPTIDLNKAGQ